MPQLLNIGNRLVAHLAVSWLDRRGGIEAMQIKKDQQKSISNETENERQVNSNKITVKNIQNDIGTACLCGVVVKMKIS